MRGGPRGSASALPLTVLLLILLPGVALGYVGLRALAEREESLRTNYTATTVLVRDRLRAELSRLESELANDLSGPQPLLLDPASVSEWLTTTSARRPWLHRPFLVRSDGALAMIGLHDRWAPRSADLTSLPRVAAAVESGEAAEFQQADLEEALRRYRHALTLTAPSPSARALVLSRIGRTLFKLRRFTAAVTAYRRVLDEGPDIIDRNGLPYAVIAMVQLGDAFEALGLQTERSRTDRQLLQYVLDHPWDLQDGYGHYLARARRSASHDVHLDARARAHADAVETIGWIRNSVLPRIGPEPGSKLFFMREPRWRGIERKGETVLIGACRAGSPLEDPPAAVLGYELRTGYIGGPMLADVLKTVDLGKDLRITVVSHGPAVSTTPAVNDGSVPLVVADFDPAVPGLQVALVHQQGRSMAQLAARERWVYGTLIVGMVLVMMVGVGFTLRASARANELSRLKSGFVSSVSHELKTPLALIRMFGETLESGIVVDEEQRQEYYRVIKRESERLTHLIDNVLDVGRIDAGTKQYRLELADLAGAVKEALDTYAPMFARLGFEVEANLPDTPVRIQMDRDAIVQALINLFQNALKYSGGRRHVCVSVEMRGSEAAVSVGDHGEGIAPSELGRIFDPYYRIRRNGHTASPGSGLGLAIVRHTMEAHGGRIDAESTIGVGSVFTLVLPIGEAADVPTSTRAREAAGA